VGNLGGYQTITTAAKEAGGVDKLISAIKKAAYGKGFGTGATVGALAVGGAVAVASRFRQAKEAREERAEAAEEQLKATLREPADPESSGS
jgi:hypothetical protein